MSYFIISIVNYCIILIISISLFSFNHQVQQFAEHEPTEVDVVSEIEEIQKCCCFGQFAGFMNINSINCGFDMESMKCATGKSWFCIWQGGNHIWLMPKYFSDALKLFFKESMYFVSTYLLWIFLQKNWTSFSLFSSWSSMNLEQRKTWEEVFVIVYTQDDNSFNFY